MYFVNSVEGDDQTNGLSPRAAWSTLTRVNDATLQPGDKVLFHRNNLWRGQLRPKSGSAGRPITYGAFGEGAKPILRIVARDAADSWIHTETYLWTAHSLSFVTDTDNPHQLVLSKVGRRQSPDDALAMDVGNIIFDHGAACGVKKWRQQDLRQNRDFWYDPESQQTWLFSDTPPSEQYRSIELAQRRHIVDGRNSAFLVFEDLSLRYGAAHGVSSFETHDIIIRRCDISFIGGGHQSSRLNGQPVRYGNGIQFWNTGRHNLVEDCRLWDIYDAALTNQGQGSDSEQVDITYRNNVIWNAEYSFEYWNGPNTAKTEDILFEHNTCVDAGHGWGHAQRPDKNGHHLMFWDNMAATRRFTVRNNIFCNATESCSRMDNDWRAGLTVDRNLWFQGAIPLFTFLHRNFAAEEIEAYRAATSFDRHSVIAKPRFRDATKSDYRLASSSPGLHWTTDGVPCGFVFSADKSESDNRSVIEGPLIPAPV